MRAMFQPLLNNFLTASGWHLFLPTDRSLRRVDDHHVPRVRRGNCHLLALRCTTAVQQC